MTATTLEQMRALAAHGHKYAAPTQYMPKETPNYVLVRELVAALRSAADEMSRLRGAIENVPHDEMCDYDMDHANACDCWKADALGA